MNRHPHNRPERWNGNRKSWAVILIVGLATWLILSTRGVASEPGERELEAFEVHVPSHVDHLTAERVAGLAASAAELEAQVARRTWELGALEPRRILEELKRLADAKQRVDRHRAELWELRKECTKVADASVRRDVVRHYLQVAAELIDLAGRLRYSLHDAIETASYLLDPHPDEFRQMIRLLVQHEVQIGATTLAYVLLDPADASGAVPFQDDVKREVLKLCRVSRDPQVVHFLAEFLRQPNVPVELAVAAMEVIREVGLPQRPRVDPSDGNGVLPLPPVTAEELLETVKRSAPETADRPLGARRDALRQWLQERAARGVPGEGYRWGNAQLRAGDWLLMRNPSPYNRFTDLGTGLFTHVGVVAEDVDKNGVRRLVIVEVPERGAQIPATNVDSYLERTLHYVFLRHEDPDVAERMGAAAASVIGNECQFDLTFRTERVAALRGRSLKGLPIHTYCAGLLLICADAAGQPRDELFPIAERSAGEQFLANLERLGMSIGDGFVSPTAPLFSHRMRIVGEREPMYDPGREVKEAIYDHFADGMRFRELHPSPDAYQQLRERVAGLARHQPWLRRAIARAADVSDQLDLEAASRAAAVVETLDEIADAAVRDFEQSRLAILLGPREAIRLQDFPPEQLKDLMELRNRHADLLGQWLAGQLTPRELRQQLVDYYADRGRRELDDRFFPHP